MVVAADRHSSQIGLNLVGQLNRIAEHVLPTLTQPYVDTPDVVTFAAVDPNNTPIADCVTSWTITAVEVTLNLAILAAPVGHPIIRTAIVVAFVGHRNAVSAYIHTNCLAI